MEVEALLLDDPIAVAAAPLPSIAATSPIVATAPIAAASPIVATSPSMPLPAPAGMPIVAGTGLAALQAASPPPLQGTTLTAPANADGPSPALTVETTPLAASAAGFSVQLGAFASYPNAQAFLGRVANQLPSIGVEAQVRQVNGLFRVLVGPFAARDDARRVADRIRAELGLPTTIAAH